MNYRVFAVLVVGVMVLAGGLSMQAQDSSRLVIGTIDDETPFVEVPVAITTQANQTLILDLRATGGNLDTMLYLVDSADNIIAQNDDRSREDFSSYIEFPEIPRGTYRVIATRYGVAAGGTSGEFELQISFAARTAEDALVYDVSEAALMTAGFPALAPQPQAKWTILAYYGGDTNLEPGILNDFKEFERAGGSTEEVRAVILIDRHPEYSTASGNWATTKIFEIGADQGSETLSIDSLELADLGSRNSGDGELLAQFLVWAVQQYPAENYAVTFASHGAAWRGVITDDSIGNAILTLPEMRKAFELATATAGVEKFELLINDACLMSSVEYHQAMADFFLYSIASPEIVVDPALDMQLFTESLNEDPSIAVDELGRLLIDTYIDRDILLRPGADNIYLTNAITRLDRFDDLLDSINSFAALINRDPRALSTLIGQARTRAYTYTAFLGSDELIDLGNFMQQIKSITDDPDILLAAEQVTKNLSDAVIYGRAGQRAESRTTYHNIYFPGQREAFTNSYFEETLLPQWGTMLRNYYNAVTPQVWISEDAGIAFHAPVAPKIRIATIFPQGEVSSEYPLNVGLEIIGRNIAYVDSTVDQQQSDGSAIRLLNQRILVSLEGERVNRWRPGVDTTDIFWDVTLPLVTDGNVSYYEPLNLTESVVSLDGRYREPDSETWNDVTLIFDYQDKVLQRIVNRSQGTDALGVISIPAGSEFQAYRQIVTPDGRVVVENGNLYRWPEGGLTWAWVPAPTGEYNIGLLVMAFGGTTGFNSVQTVVNNDNIDPTLRMSIRQDTFSVIPRAEDWSEYSIFFTDWPFLRTENPEGTQNITVYVALLRPASEDLEDIADMVIEQYGLTSDREYSTNTIGDEPILEFNLAYEDERGIFDGRGIAVFVEDFGIGFVYAAHTLQETDSPDDLFNFLRDNIKFFDAADLERGSDRQWVSNETEHLVYPTPITWEQEEDPVWLTYRSPEDPSGLTFVRIAMLGSNGEASESQLAQRFEQFVAPDANNLSIQNQQIYNGEFFTWTANSYDGMRGDVPIYGRFYHAIGQVPGDDEGDETQERGFVIWVETPQGEDAARIITEELEPIVDGLRLTSSR